MDEQQGVSGTAPLALPERWRPLAKVDRRVAGVLVEKAKTTPEQYPLTINSLVNGCNQKNNRDPQMQLEEADVMESLDRLKSMGAVAEVQGSGRVPKFRHLLYEWLGVEKVELAVMGELLLRSAQTEGELRGRASRMEPIADLNALRGILQSLRGSDWSSTLRRRAGGRLSAMPFTSRKNWSGSRKNSAVKARLKADGRSRRESTLCPRSDTSKRRPAEAKNCIRCVGNWPNCAANWSRLPKPCDGRKPPLPICALFGRIGALGSSSLFSTSFQPAGWFNSAWRLAAHGVPLCSVTTRCR